MFYGFVDMLSENVDFPHVDVNSASVNLNTTLLSSMTCEVLLITPRVYTSGVFV